MSRFRLDRQVAEDLIEHARIEAPFEACGMVGGSEMSASKAYPTKNSDSSRITYTIDPQEAFEVIRKMRSDGFDFIASYHSHPASEAYPSPTDCEKAWDPNQIYIIVSLQDPDDPRIRAFTIKESGITELVVETSD